MKVTVTGNISAFLAKLFISCTVILFFVWLISEMDHTWIRVHWKQFILGLEEWNRVSPEDKDRTDVTSPPIQTMLAEHQKYEDITEQVGSRSSEFQKENPSKRPEKKSFGPRASLPNTKIENKPKWKIPPAKLMSTKVPARECEQTVSTTEHNTPDNITPEIRIKVQNPVIETPMTETAESIPVIETEEPPPVIETPGIELAPVIDIPEPAPVIETSEPPPVTETHEQTTLPEQPRILDNQQRKPTQTRGRTRDLEARASGARSKSRRVVDQKSLQLQRDVEEALKKYKKTKVEKNKQALLESFKAFKQDVTSRYPENPAYRNLFPTYEQDLRDLGIELVSFDTL